MIATALILSQTGPSESMKFWLPTALGIVSLITTIFMPFILSGIRSIRERLASGDKKFEEIGEGQARMEERVDGIKETVSEIRDDVKAANAKASDFNVEGQGSVQQLRAEIERDFVRKPSLDKLEQRLEQRMNENHAETMRAIHDLRGKR